MRYARRRFYISLAVTTALGSFSLWRVDATVWRPATERVYLFPARTWPSYVERCWLNDALYAFGMAALLYLLYTLKEIMGARSESDAALSADRWTEHQERSRLMIGTGVTIVLIWAWLEETADLVPGYIFDKWDVAAIYLGFAAGCWLLDRLSYPVFAASPPFWAGPVEHSPWPREAARTLSVAFLLAYTACVEPETLRDRWSHLAEASVLVLGVKRMLSWRGPPARSVDLPVDV